MLNHIEAATRCAMPAAGSSRTAFAAVSAYTTRMSVIAFSPLGVDARNDVQGASHAWSPPV
jgi:hypothetical protein